MPSARICSRWPVTTNAPCCTTAPRRNERRASRSGTILPARLLDSDGPDPWLSRCGTAARSAAAPCLRTPRPTFARSSALSARTARRPWRRSAPTAGASWCDAPAAPGAALGNKRVKGRQWHHTPLDTQPGNCHRRHGPTLRDCSRKAGGGTSAGVCIFIGPAPCPNTSDFALGRRGA